jgi:Ca2+-binding EF-hand superfamily protein
MMQQGQARGGHGHGSAAQTSALFAALDKDNDGKLSRVELEQAVAALKKLDTDSDGYLSPSECAPRGGHGHGGGGHGHGHGGTSDPQAEATETVNTLMGFDKNDDGSLTKEELPERMQNVIARADTNRDEIASEKELMAMALKEATPVSQGRSRRGGRGRFRQGATPTRPELESNNDQ